MKLLITIPAYLSDPLHQEFTQETITSIQTKHDYHILVVINHLEESFKPFIQELSRTQHLSVIHNPNGNILAASWNIGAKEAIKQKADYTLIINNDIIFHHHAIDNLVKFAQDQPEFILWSGTEWPAQRSIQKATWNGSFSEHPHFSCFMISQKTINVVGYFDENFKLGYFEDNDYHTRILLSGNQAAATTTCKFYHYGSRTINIDDGLRIKSQYYYQQNRQYFKKKWGLDIHNKGFKPPEIILKQIYPTPFNKKQNSIKDW